ncbi:MULTISPECIES: ABC transporter ATP-binding protein [Gordonia]|uniref:ABC transporter ATP-binding protein n=1 Tax=Gordonia cholesterolivorans TaxID=559625 RepID=A0ABN3HZC0_9ACTN|nr:MULTISPECIES: ATP-binding cassette domain-containing protein [Gordonia]KJR06251.1 ABC transporter [Gordonia sihwensis]KXT56145.1 ABC transporter [Gordonia sp. QH-12]MBY4570468.1 ABC transporter [Gordonia sihwensis]WFN92954.1 ATP-binding cassette domain-containing protein [Gordonia sihwensis]
MVSKAIDVPATPTGGLRAREIAAIAIFSGLTVVPAVIVSVVPLAAALGFMTPVPVALLAARTRPRAVLAAIVTTVAVTFVVAGLGPAFAVLVSAVMGGLIGEVHRRGGRMPAMALMSLLASPILAGVSVLLMWVLVPLRKLALEVLDNVLTGIAKTARAIRLDAVGDAMDALSRNVVDNWWLWMWIPGVIGTLVTLLIAGWLLGKVLDRLDEVPLEDTLEIAGIADGDRPVEPLPLRMAGVGYTYPGSDRQVLHNIDLSLISGEFVAVVGANGSGKSTLAKLLAGVDPTIGIVDRPGAPGLGREGGTALVLQRPEAQMLGARVADDLVWGLPDDAEVDVDGLLAEVGLAGLGDRETTDLSGGQQQRLAVAAALARSPQLLIADEVTSMVDPVGRAELIEILAELPRRRAITVVLITHRDSEARAADRVIHLEAGRVVEHHPEWMRPEAISPPLPQRHDEHGQALLVVRDLAHTYLPGSPWEVTALKSVNFQVNSGDGVLIVGGNGSGKSTLAWILAGLITPTRGSVLLGGEPTAERVGDVGLGFQHARLQLQKTTVADEIMAVGGLEVGTAEVGHVLDLVALPREIAARRVDALSGGQMRRVVLASLIASGPELLVLDEPLAGLDPQAREEVLAVLAGLREKGATIIIISHDLESLDRVCNRRIELVDGVLEGGL